jgi:uncharacterized membrane protein YebE (DUF533 family)
MTSQAVRAASAAGFDARALLGSLMGLGLQGLSRHAGFVLVEPDLRQGMAAPRGLLGVLDAMAGGDMGRGPHGGLGHGSALALLACLAFDALKQRDRATGQRLADRLPGTGDAVPGTGGEPFFGYAGGIGQPGRDIDDTHALLLVDAAITALQACKRPRPEAQAALLDRLGCGRAARDYVAGRLGSPCSVDDLAARVDGPETARDVYAAALVALDGDTQAERSWLADLAARLGLSTKEVSEMRVDLG